MKIFNILFSTVVLIMGAYPANAISIQRDLCENETYKKANPSKCKNTLSSSMFGIGGLAIGGTIAATGAAALAVIGTSSGGGGSGGAPAPSMPTLQTYNYVGGDVGATYLASVMSDKEYVRNNNQFNEIRLGYSLARGYTGKNSTIAVLDDTRHGAAVSALASGPVAPDAKVEFYKIANPGNKFLTYQEIGNVIRTAGTSANIINASWNSQMRADAIYSRDQISRLTDSNFINQLATAANNGTIFVWAAGNEYSTQSGALSALPRVVSELRGHFINVVAWDDKTGALADFSNQCGITMEYCITAPGTDLSAADRNVSGTSFAAPIVSAAVAVVRETFPYMTPEQITDLLFKTARDLGEPGTDPVYGHGMLDLERATRPVGVELVPLDNGMTAPMRTARVSGTIARQIRGADLKFAYVDEYGRAFQADMNDHIKVKNHSRALEHLHHTDKTSATIGNIEFGFRQSEFLAADGLLGTDQKNTISFIATKNTFSLGESEIFTRTELGMTRPHGRTDSMITKFSGIYTASVEIGARHGDFMAAVSIPDAIIDGNMQMRIPTGRTNTGTLTFLDSDISLAGRPSIEYMIGYKNITAGFVDNPSGTDELYIIAQKKLRF